MRSAARSFVIAVFALLLAAQAPGGKRISIYTAQTSFSLPVVDHNSTEYAGLFEILEPIGAVSSKVDKHRWRIKFRDVDSEFDEGKTRAKVAGKDFSLNAPFLIENNRGLVPLDSVAALVSSFTGIAADYHSASRRLFVGATPVRYQAQVQVQKGTVPRLVLSFSAPVNPSISTEHGMVRLMFVRDPLVSSGNDQTSLNDSVFSSAVFAETNGASELAVRVTTPVIASFSDANRTITLTPIAPPLQAGQTAPAPPAPLPQTTPAEQATPGVQRPPFFILIDPAHGGSDRGAALTDKIAEKDVVLYFARRLRAEFYARGIPVRLLRESDAEIPSDARATAINTSHAAAVILLHASTVGNGVHISTAALPSNASPRWESAQSMFAVSSNEWANAMAGEVLKHNVAVLRLRASVPPLNQVALPALVVEVTPLASRPAESLFSANYVQAIISSVAGATVAQRDRLSQGAR